MRWAACLSATRPRSDKRHSGLFPPVGLLVYFHTSPCSPREPTLASERGSSWNRVGLTHTVCVCVGSVLSDRVRSGTRHPRVPATKGQVVTGHIGDSSPRARGLTSVLVTELAARPKLTCESARCACRDAAPVTPGRWPVCSRDQRLSSLCAHSSSRGGRGDQGSTTIQRLGSELNFGRVNNHNIP